jgi:hypothetical protein
MCSFQPSHILLSDEKDEIIFSGGIKAGNDDPKLTQHGRLVADHVDRRIISKLLPLG